MKVGKPTFILTYLNRHSLSRFYSMAGWRRWLFLKFIILIRTIAGFHAVTGLPAFQDGEPIGRTNKYISINYDVLVFLVMPL